MYKFSNYENSGYVQENKGYYKKLEKLGVKVDLSLPKITAEEVKNFLDEEFYKEIIVVAPVASCSILCGYDPLINRLSELFGCEVHTVYGYVKTPMKKYHYFDDAGVRRALAGEIFDNHHAWFQFENGQLLDLVFLNTMRVANKMLDATQNEFEFILADDGSKVGSPTAMSIVERTVPSSFHYVPMFRGKMFASDALVSRAIQTDNMVTWVS